MQKSHPVRLYIVFELLSLIPCAPFQGDIVNVLGEWTETSSCGRAAISVSARHNFFIHHPDILITATALSNTSQCLRKPLLANMIRSTSDVTPALVWGNVLHEVMQTCMSVQRWDEKFVNKRIAEVCQASMGELVRIDMDVDQAIIEVKARAKGLKVFAEKYISDSPKVSYSLCCNVIRC